MTRLLALACMWATTGCGAASAVAELPSYQPEGQTKCSIAPSQTRPLIVEWPSADRVALETQARRGVVAVRYDGCEMMVLRHCVVPGSYRYSAATRQDDNLSIKNDDELYAAIPIHAATFESKLATSGVLNVAMSIVGTFDAERSAISGEELRGDCFGATHIVSGMTVGAFEFSAGADAEVGAEARAFGAGALGTSVAKKEILNRAGDRAACTTKATDASPPGGCGAVLRLEVMPLRPAAPPQAQPQHAYPGRGPGPWPHPQPAAHPQPQAPPEPQAATPDRGSRENPDETGRDWRDVYGLASKAVNRVDVRSCGYNTPFMMSVAFQRDGTVKRASVSTDYGGTPPFTATVAQRNCIESRYRTLRVPAFDTGEQYAQMSILIEYTTMDWIIEQGRERR